MLKILIMCMSILTLETLKSSIMAKAKEIERTHIFKCPNIFANSDDLEKSEYPVRVEWIKTVPRNEARFKRKYGLFTTQLVRASLSNQPKTMEFLESEFGVRFADLMK